jgi:branched-subunit amino acid aminotransferase/4-amino-4-deoxychorismate lyase
MTNSIIGVWPVVRIGEQPFSIGHITKQLQAAVANIE